MVPSATRPIPIAFCITDLDVGGAERALVRIVTGLNRSRWVPSVYCLSAEGELADMLRRSDVPVTCLGVHVRRDFSVLWKLRRELKGVRPALLQTFLYHANIVGRLAGTAARVPVIVSGIRVAEKRSRLRLWVDRATESLVDAHVCVSRDVARFSTETGRLSSRKVRVIPNGVDADLHAAAAPADLSELGIPKGSQTILFVGRLDAQKSPLLLLSAMERLLDARPELHVLLVGDGPQRNELSEWIAARPFGSRIHLAGRRRDVPSLLRSATVFVLPSLWEGQPNVVLEAMAAGIPVVATRVEGVSDLVVEGKTGLTVPLNSADELGAAIQRVLDDPEAAIRMGRAAQSVVREQFTWGSVIQAYERLYLKLLEKPQLAPSGPSA